VLVRFVVGEDRVDFAFVVTRVFVAHRFCLSVFVLVLLVPSDTIHIDSLHLYANLQ